MNVGFELFDNIFIDVFVCYDIIEVLGELIFFCCGGNVDYDINGNGVIE